MSSFPVVLLFFLCIGTVLSVQLHKEYQSCRTDNNTEDILLKLDQAYFYKNSDFNITSWKQDLHSLCLNKTGCLANMINNGKTDSVTLQQTREEFTYFSEKCAMLKWMTGDFNQCYDSLYVLRKNPLKSLLIGKSTNVCEFSITEMSDLIAIINTHCGAEAIKDFYRNEKLAQKILCRFSMHSIVFPEELEWTKTENQSSEREEKEKSSHDYNRKVAIFFACVNLIVLFVAAVIYTVFICIRFKSNVQ